MTAAPTAANADPIADDAHHILVVDDDQRIRDLLARYLVQNGYRVTTAPDVANARASMRGLAFDLILLDWMMPGESGIDLARELTGRADVPVCMLTARTDPDERVIGLEAGVEDFIHKPFEPRELLLRLRNILRRGQAANGNGEEIRMGAFVFHITRGELKRGDESIKLTERERELLRLFAGKQGQPIPRYELSSDDSTGSERAIDVQINRLRRKIETDPSNPVYLQTVRGKGYILYVD